MRYSNGAVSHRDLDRIDPDEMTEWAKAFDHILRKEYPDKK